MNPDQKKLLKEEKKKKKLEKFLLKKTANMVVSSKKPKEEKNEGYDPSFIEAKWYKYWEENNMFIPRDSDRKFVLTIPPPNVTGTLHIGHAMMVSIQDCICRYKRLNGYEVLYLPGTDHAGIATQSVVCKELEKKGLSYDREFFLKAAWEWNEKYGNRIIEQFKRLGTSVDFSRKRFTLDKDMNYAVNQAFVTLYDRGLIYREPKIVNWCGKLKTTLSDLEINHETVAPNKFIEVDGKSYEFGVIYSFKYPIETECGNFKGDVFIEVETTRPETILGDTAICANPKDERYKYTELYKKFKIPNKYDNIKFVASNPLTGKKIPIIYDDHSNMEFGSGVLKITPAHDPIDFEIGKRHNLEIIKIFDEENKIIVKGEFFGLKRFDARLKVVDALKKKNLFVEKKKYEQVLPFCSRSNDIIEPLIKEQWWCKCDGMAKKACEAVETDKIKIYPEEANKHWFRWLDNIRDWCLSRQLWWGHRIPAYKSPSGKWCIGMTKEDAMRKYYNEYPTEPLYSFEDFVQDEDVLDTWFSSGLWPFATLGWPNLKGDFEKYFPTDLLETGSDILFFWVARMVMLSLELTGKIPFSKVLLHGIVRDAHGRKMSKSLGNVIDPTFVIDGSTLDNLIDTMKAGNLSIKEIKTAEKGLRCDFKNGIQKCGADALRFTLLSYVLGMKDINLDILRVEGYRRFCNKLWNANKFCKMMLDEFLRENNSIIIDDLILDENSIKHLESYELFSWLISRRNKVIKEVHKCFENYNFMLSTQVIHQFILYEFCDVYIEILKSHKGRDYISLLISTFIDILKILHPFMPFITEELYHTYFDSTIMYSEYPKIYEHDFSNSFGKILNLTKELRSIIDHKKYNKVSIEISRIKCLKDDCYVYLSSLIKKVENVDIREEITDPHFIIDEISINLVDKK